MGLLCNIKEYARQKLKVCCYSVFGSWRCDPEMILLSWSESYHVLVQLPRHLKVNFVCYYFTICLQHFSYFSQRQSRSWWRYGNNYHILFPGIFLQILYAYILAKQSDNYSELWKTIYNSVKSTFQLTQLKFYLN